jgi:hypothetical protein
VEFFDFLYLGVFVILSLAYDHRFYNGGKPVPRVMKEAAYAVDRFHTLLQIFSQRFFLLLEGEPVSVLYVVNRMLGEFAAASMVLAKGINESEGYNSDDEVEDRIKSSALAGHIESILKAFDPKALAYYSRCLDCEHKDFLWTGPCVEIFPRSEPFVSLIDHLTKGEILDLPFHQIYTEDVDADQPLQPDNVTQVGKRRDRGDSPNLERDQPKKRSRKS